MRTERGCGRSADHVLDAAVQCIESGADRGLADVFADSRDSRELLAASRAEHGQGDQDGAIAAGRGELDEVEFESCSATSNSSTARRVAVATAR